MNPIFVKSFLTPLEAEALLASVQCLAWTRGQFRGRPVPREEVWIGPYAYKFSGRTLEPASWTAEIAAIRGKIQAQHGGDYNRVQLNRYATTQDRLSWRCDEERNTDSEDPPG